MAFSIILIKEIKKILQAEEKSDRGESNNISKSTGSKEAGDGRGELEEELGGKVVGTHTA